MTPSHQINNGHPISTGPENVTVELTHPVGPVSDRSSRMMQPWGYRVFETLVICLIFAWYAGQLPPDVNESHYLTKARHFWDPSWCPDDIFLSSSFSHWLFYLITGWLNSFLSLTQVAWTGRILTWLSLAFSWQRLCWNLNCVRGSAILAAVTFLLLNDRFHLAGEWVVGGYEAKGLAYACVLMALGSMVTQRWSAGWVWLGGATAFHVLVGGWSWVATSIALLNLGFHELRSGLGLGPAWYRLAGGNDEVNLGARLGLPVGLLISMLGVLPPLLGDAAASAEQTGIASSIYVNDRIAHHLNFAAFPISHVARFVALVTGLFLVAKFFQPRFHRQSIAWRLLYLFSIGSLVISFGGLVLSAIAEQDQAANIWSARWLKFYWFRLADFAVPLTVATAIAVAVMELIRTGSRSARVAAITTLIALTLAGGIMCAQRNADPRPRADRKSLPNYPGQPDRTLGTYRNWIKVCDWIRLNTPADARFITPAQQQTFKWYAQRHEVVNWKDVPQDAESMIEWHQRLRELVEPQRRYEAGLMSYTDQQLREIGQRYGASFLVVPQRQVDALLQGTELQQVYPADSETRSTYVVLRL